jgi:hypothetical protein
MEMQTVQLLADEFNWWAVGKTFRLVNVGGKGDLRSVMINKGLGSTSARYIAFLDYDDIAYDDAAENLIGALKENQAAISFGKIIQATVSSFGSFDFIDGKKNVFWGTDKFDLFINNFCPIHSFVIDRSMIAQEDMYFDENLTKNEDYSFLLRIVAKYPSDFSHVNVVVGEYFVRRDGTNTIIGIDREPNKKKIREWQEAENYIQKIRENTNAVIKISDIVKFMNEIGGPAVNHGRGQQDVLASYLVAPVPVFSTGGYRIKAVTSQDATALPFLLPQNLKWLVNYDTVRHHIKQGPAAGYIETVSDTEGFVRLTGWCCDPEERCPALALVVYIDERIDQILSEFIPRNDVKKFLECNADEFGFSLSVPVEKLQRSSVNLYALTTSMSLILINPIDHKAEELPHEVTDHRQHREPSTVV